MVELLAIPRFPKYPEETKALIHMGQPLGKVSGLERLPLYNKIPMQKSPYLEGASRKIKITTRRKIAQPYILSAKEFSSFTGDVRYDYNPLTDKHLTHFFRNPTQMKKLRDLGEIDKNDYVLCSPRVFNECRRDLHLACLAHVRKQLDKLEEEKTDRLMVRHAEEIHKEADEAQHRDYKDLLTVLRRKQQHEDEKRARAHHSLHKTYSRMEAIERLNEWKELRKEEKKILTNLRVHRHIMKSVDDHRVRLCLIKRKIQMKAARVRFCREKIAEVRRRRAEFNKSRRPEIWHEQKLKVKAESEEGRKRLQEKYRLIEERMDLMMVEHAEAQEFKHQKAEDNPNYKVGNREAILKKKQELEHAKALRARWHLMKAEQRMKNAEKRYEMREMLMQYRKMLTDLKIQKHFEKSANMDQIRRCGVKKKIADKERSKKIVLQRNKKNDYLRRKEKFEFSQNQSIQHRMETQKYLDYLIQENKDMLERRILEHKLSHKIKWQDIEDEIRLRCSSRTKKIKRISTPQPRPSDYFLHQICTQKEYMNVLNTVVDLQNKDEILLDEDTYIYKAAEYILANVIRKFNEDLSKDERLLRQTAERIQKLIDEVKKVTLAKATKVISTYIKQSGGEICDSNKQHVSFCVCPLSVIGTSSYEVKPQTEVKSTLTRRPTPVSSLTSVIVDESKPEMIFCPTERIFVEHLLIRLKRELINGVGRKVFNAIECHRHGGFMTMATEFLKVRKSAVACRMAESILSYAINKQDFAASVLLCINYLSAEIIISLQKQLI